MQLSTRVRPIRFRAAHPLAPLLVPPPQVIAAMTQLNTIGTTLGQDPRVHALTDVTGECQGQCALMN